MQQTLDHSNFEIEKVYGHSIKTGHQLKSNALEDNPKFSNYEIDSNYEKQNLAITVIEDNFERDNEPKIGSQYTS